MCREQSLKEIESRARLVVMATEVGGRWSQEAVQFLRQLAFAKVRNEAQALRHSARLSSLRRWGTIMVCSAARAFSLSLLEQRSCVGGDGPTPTTSEVVHDQRHW